MMILLKLLQLVVWIWTGVTVAKQPHKKGTVLYIAAWIPEIYDPNGIITCSDHYWKNELGGKYLSDGTLTYVQTTGELLWCGGVPGEHYATMQARDYDDQCLILDNNKFVPHSRLTQGHPEQFHTVVVNGKVWLFGGDFNVHFTEGYVIESLEGNKWSVQDAPRTPLEHMNDACSVFTGEALILIGGHTTDWKTPNNQKRLSGNVSKLIPGSGNQWESLTPLPAPREKHGCLYLPPNDKFPEGSILVAGGAADLKCKKCFSDSLLYNISQDSWIPAGEIGLSHTKGSLVDIDGRVVFAGGYSVCNGTLPHKPYAYCSNVKSTDRVHEFHLENLGTEKATWTELNHTLRYMGADDAAAVIPIEYWNNGKSCKIPNSLPTPPPPPAEGMSDEMCISSPNYPNNYPNNLRTTTKFSVEAGEDIEITLIEVDTEKKSGSWPTKLGPCKDFIRFYDANGKAVKTSLGTDLCGNGRKFRNSQFVIPTSSGSVYFYSDGSVSKRGFKFCYKPAKLWRDDGRCGLGTYLENAYGSRGQCDPSSTENGKGPCCSSHGFCGPFAVHCDCPGCINYKKGHTGCNGADVDIECCPRMTHGDNNGEREIFLQENEIIEETCQANCQRLHPDCVGITESRDQTYSNGQPKCWCEFGVPKLGHSWIYQTCLFKP